MKPSLKAVLLQLDPIVGAMEANVAQIREGYLWSADRGADLVVTPELAVCGYPPLDLLDRVEFVERAEKITSAIASWTVEKSAALAVGTVRRNAAGRLQNGVAVFEGGKEVHFQAKSLLPTYDVFDERRYFEPAAAIDTWSFRSREILFSICEDLWSDQLFEKYRNLEPDLVISVSASPYEARKRETRAKIHAHAAKALRVPLLYVNQASATDEILFDGESFAMDAEGATLGTAPAFETARIEVEITPTQEVKWIGPTSRELKSEDEVLLDGLVFGIRSYFSRTGFDRAIIGLSGGIDSALVAVLATHALGPRNVFGVAMPGPFSSSHSIEDAEALAKALGIRFEVRPIKFSYAQISRDLGETRGGKLKEVALENLQSRLRALTLMTLSNHEGSLVLTTGNKSEIAMGYCTLYGDMCGALNPIGDLYKTRVYEIARLSLERWGAVIPERTFVKPPSAELRANQVDQDSLPPYADLDAWLEDYIEGGMSPYALAQKYGDQVYPVLQTHERAEFKRRQAAPLLRVTSKAFGIGRRVPIARRIDLI